VVRALEVAEVVEIIIPSTVVELTDWRLRLRLRLRLSGSII
jgi:hypothetical protein